MTISRENSSEKVSHGVEERNLSLCFYGKNDYSLMVPSNIDSVEIRIIYDGKGATQRLAFRTKSAKAVCLFLLSTCLVAIENAFLVPMKTASFLARVSPV